MIKARLSKKVTYGLGFICLLLLEYRYFGNSFSKSSQETAGIQFIMLTLILVAILASGKLYKCKEVVLPFLLCVYMTLITIILKTEFTESYFVDISKTALWLLVYLMGYYAARDGVEKNTFSIPIVIMLITFEIQYWGSLTYDFTHKNKDYVVTSVYYILCCMPYIILLHNRKVKTAFIVSIALTIAFSLKRSALVVLVACGLVMFIKEYNSTARVKRNMIIAIFTFMIFALFCLPMVLKVNNSALGLLWKTRFTNGATDRIDIYLDIWKNFLSSDVLSILFGHGQNAVLRTSSYGLSAHNDFLEILFDYGIIGLIIFCAFLLRLIRSMRNFKQIEDPCLEKGFVCALTIFIVASIPSHMLTYSTYFLLLSFYLGYSTGTLSRGGSYGQKNKNWSSNIS